MSYLKTGIEFAHISIFELVVGSALSRGTVNSEGELIDVISEWLQVPVPLGEIEQAAQRLAARGYIADGTAPLAELALTEKGTDGVTRSYHATIRMLDRGLNLLRASMLVNIINGKGESDA
ncbi:hypothetical protein [Altericroceibacterium spongiae]|uniref:hypothetical protein n=1 Tax=Altericroceibacterium spongiae TaxID=2320269 RepID=UPI0011C360C2|nr:hypothetical protein [Altericroceibacterium spongiae]